MKKYLAAFLCLIFPAFVFAQTIVENYPVDPASVEHDGVPKGETIKVKFTNSKIYPGTFREYTIYVPAQYDAAKPACVWVNQDAVQFKATTVFDNLINNHEMPVTIGVFITPGQVQAPDEKTALNRYNRSFEYDGLGDEYARFILEEILPDVEKHTTKDGRPIHLSKSGNDRGIGGTSSGGIAAFTAAWERPDAFTRVATGIGTFVGIRGGDTYSALIRKYEAKPIRVFLQDGANDHNSYAGDWFKANEMMERSLIFAGYQVKAIYGQGDHNSKMLTAYFPDAMRFLWKDYPQAVGTTPSKNDNIKAITLPAEGWQQVSTRIPYVKGIKVGKDGNVAFDQQAALNNNVTANSGNKYSFAHGSDKIYLTRPNRTKILVDAGIKYPSGIALTPDQTQLYVTESGSKWIWIYQIKADGTLTYKQRLGRLYLPDTANNAGTHTLRCDTAGRVYAATSMGVQVLDQIGKVTVIFPFLTGEVTDLAFGGANLDMLYIVSGGKVFQRN